MRQRIRHIALALSAAVVVGTGVLTPVQATASAASRPDTVRQGLDALVRTDGVPAALATVRDRDGRTRHYTAGVGDLATGAKVPVDGQVRIGSNTKTFTAVVVLQLVGEGKVDLDALVDRYLPGLIRGEGIDGGHITVRQLLQHTSGLADYEGLLDEPSLRDRYFEPRELLDLALAQKPVFAPGEKFGYSSTNYVLAGLLVQKVTGRPLAEEIDRRIVRHLGLRHTYFPAVGDRTIREPHPRGYRKDTPDGPLGDFTEMDPSAGWAAGQMISTGSDLNRFFSELLAGNLLPPAQLAQMRTTVPIGDTGAGAGLGILSRPLSCGGVYWGHGGDIPGYETRGGVTDDGRAVSVAVTTVPTDYGVTERLEGVVDAAFCR
ncbi:serine hydrolase [Kitasatospora xanthocidica]|uniref:serine hydrolase domain-containing protein n=1 Tax=Kitasatospora xanthocidica TaxID=83382 RepID=UPI001675EA85|nr:serine hydrolase domain-containing protein [Kitasatospora xanthocidica]GHF58012.1 serine hydrolase [Kitasatospora xanthocidica]